MFTYTYPGLCLVPNICKQLEEQFNFMTQETTSFEGDVFFNNTVSIKGLRIANIKLDSYASIKEGSNVSNTTLGSYSTVAENVIIGSPKVAISKLTTSSVLSTHSLFAEYTGITKSEEGSRTMFRNYKPVCIDHDVWIGANSCISGGVHIGTGAVIYPGSVVTKDIEPYTVIEGRDKRKGQRFSDEICSDLLESQWWKYDIKKMKALNKEIPLTLPKEFLLYLKTIPSQEKIVLPQKWQKLHPIDYEYFEIIDVAVQQLPF